ncbi:hypothetical protein BFP72_10500 [Reichenbachiella sp. 5M10]|uniref:type VI-B CRISPR-associated RNA-guided ribonuclease Cas13b n=1 Tax=Reichenbachiella sp. 5M10 TaxID=1889772 RepID=UPI000C15D600|nr:type VI-B CRISPR-associated RNA-guided ribonuclease Cas13b [Reichenbachiella sp. 5M10]PIB35793.1 hypothetical protein BFP72_10500 [Reichenbachiella sp. 5M10]
MKTKVLGNSPFEKPNYKKFKREEDKPFYATYLNTAKQNVFLILREISDKLELGFTTKDTGMLSTELWSKLKNNDQPEVSQKIIERLENQFTFLRQLALNHARDKAYSSEVDSYQNDYNGDSQDKINSNEAESSPEDYHDVLKLWIEQLNSYRNYYTHAKHKPVQLDPAVIDGMRDLFDADWKEFKDRFGFEDSVVGHLIRRGKNGELANFTYAFADRHGTTEKGFLYFVCLWLEKKDAQELLKKHEGFKRSSLSYEKATLERYTWFRTKIPKPKLVSDHSEAGLFMDMVNELKRCPQPLYNTLSEKDKDTFKQLDTADASHGQESEGDEDYTLTPVLKRHSNRFYYFALRYLDQSFEHLRFHVDLGNYCFHSYDQVIEDMPRKRRWIKRMTGFGKLTDFDEAHRPATWGEKLPDPLAQEKPDTYITKTTPHYHLDGTGEVKNIGIKWVDSYDRKKIWPNVSEPYTHGKSDRPHTEAPDFWLSLYELPAVAFYQMLHLQNKDRVHQSAETVIRDYQQNLKNFLTAVAQGRISPGYTLETLSAELDKSNLRISYIPKAVVKYLLNKKGKAYDEKANIRLQELQKENSRLLSKVNRQKPHYHKHTSNKDYVAMKAGYMADFLARDMIRLQQPIDQDQGKANGTEFQLLQAKLALFGKSKDTLHVTFKLCNLIDAANPHPFLHKIKLSKCHGILAFYTEYLHLRDGYLLQCLQEKKYNKYHFLKLNPVDTNIQTLIERQLDAVMNLPRGLFKQPILQAMTIINATKTLVQQLKELPSVNVAYMIQSYFEHVRHDGNQEFYTYKRNYELLDKLYDNKTGRSKTKARYFTGQELEQKTKEIKQKLAQKIDAAIRKKANATEEEKQRIRDNYQKAYKAFTHSEKQIRLHKSCDTVLFMMVDHMYRYGDFLLDRRKKKNEQPQLLELADSYKLRSIKPDTDQSFLSMLLPIAIPVFYPEKTSKHQRTIAREQLKVKNYGDFRSFLKDRRLYTLLPYISDEVVQFEAIQREFAAYHRSRESVFEKILSFEKTVIAQHNIQPNKYGYIEHKDILDEARIPEEQYHQMIDIRNALCHGTYPNPEKFKDQVDGSDFNALKHIGLNAPEASQKSIITQLEQIALRLYEKPKKN